jgi:hypothetical protein
VAEVGTAAFDPGNRDARFRFAHPRKQVEINTLGYPLKHIRSLIPVSSQPVSTVPMTNGMHDPEVHGLHLRFRGALYVGEIVDLSMPPSGA